MNYLMYLGSVDTEITIEKLDEVAKTLAEKLKAFAKLFGILIGWFIFNIVIALFVNRTHSLTLDAYRLLADGFRSLETQNIFIVFTVMFDDKIGCVITLAVMFSFGAAFFVRFLNLGGDSVMEKRVNKRSDDTRIRFQGEAYVVSYKQQVAFLA